MSVTQSNDRIERALAALGPGPLSEERLRTHVFPLFARTLGIDAQQIYLANHSLGRPLDAMEGDVREALDAWYEGMDDAWGPWLAEMQRWRAGTARLIGCARSDALVPKTSAGQGLRAVLNAMHGVAPGARPVVVASDAEFDSIDFILRTYAHKGRIDLRSVQARPSDAAPGLRLVHADDYVRAIAALPKRAPALVVCSQVVFATGQLLSHEELGAIIAAARHAGAWSMVDTYHSAGVLPVGFDALGCDFAIGGSYKYLRGGPGVCWLAIHERHLPVGHDPEAEGKPRTLDTGWFAKKDTFLYQRPSQPLLSAGGDAWLESTMAVLPFYQARSGLGFVLGVGVERLREYSLRQQATLAAALRGQGVPVVELAQRGAFVLVPSSDAMGLAKRLREHGVNTDARGAFVRLCPDVLTTQAQLERAAELIGKVLRA